MGCSNRESFARFPSPVSLWRKMCIDLDFANQVDFTVPPCVLASLWLFAAVAQLALKT